MTFMAQLRKIMSVGLLVLTLLFGTAFINNDQTQALAKSNQGDSSVAAYRRLQQATYDYRGQLQNQDKPDQRAGRAITERMNNRSNLSDRGESMKQNGKNWARNVKQSVKQAADTAREKLSD
jgi:hypothetical protein